MRSPLARTVVDPLDVLLARWRLGRGRAARVRSIHAIAPSAARSAPLPEALGPQVQQALRARGLSSLYSHQREAITCALEGRHVVLATPTASGKSLCFHAPVLDAMTWGATALYLMPTRALAQDQAASLRAWIDAMPGDRDGWAVELYDGDTPQAERRGVRERATILITTPDMLHGAILPHHALWRRLLAALEYVVVDELHLYRGVFGAHVSNVLRRLTRIAAHYGAAPTFIGASATVANPQDLARRVFSTADVALVDRSGASAPPRTVCFIDPAVPIDGQRATLLEEAASVVAELGRERLGVMAFVRSRAEVEALVKLLGGSGRSAAGLRVAGYRGGHSAEHRRDVERAMRAGELDVIVTTSALEVGIDVGGVDAVVIAGYPGTLASTWQQIGRAGRRGGHALAVIIADDRPADRFLLAQPAYLLDRSPEHARLAPDSPRVVAEHLRCACHELPLRHDAAWGGLKPAAVAQILTFMAERGGDELVRSPLMWRWRGGPDVYPAADIALRSAPQARWRVMGPRGEGLGEVGEWSAPGSLWVGAAYSIGRAVWRVERLDAARRVAYAVVAPPGYERPAAIVAQEARLDEVLARGPVGRCEAGLGWGRVVRRCVGLRPERGAHAVSEAPEAPECVLATQVMWWKVRGLGGDDARLGLVRRGLERVIVQAACLVAMAEEADLVALWRIDEEAGTLILADAASGGSGVAELCYEEAEAVLRAAYQVVDLCNCARGCPACVGAPGEAGAWCKGDVVWWLGHMMPRSNGAKKALKV
jgi:DEAD/DEAH box helicase domain-containing protein